MRTPFLALARALASIKFRVLSVKGVCKVIKSARANNASSSTFSTPISTARSGVKNGSKAMTRIFKPMPRVATIDPILPQPITPSVLPVSSTPIKRFLSHLPSCVERLASGISRANANIMAMACSAVVIELPKGVFITTIPRSVAAGRSTLSTPIPARPITFSLSAAAITGGVALVDERTAKPS